MPRAQEAQERPLSDWHNAGCAAQLSRLCTAHLYLYGRQGGAVSYFRTCREPIHGGAFSTSCLVRS